MFFQVVDFVITAQCHIAGKCNDFYSRSHNQESHIETDLVVSCTSRTVSYCMCVDFVGVTSNGKCLEDTFRTYRNRISTVTQYVTEYHILQALSIVFLSNVECNIFNSSQFVSVFFVLF